MFKIKYVGPVIKSQFFLTVVATVAVKIIAAEYILYRYRVK